MPEAQKPKAADAYVAPGLEAVSPPCDGFRPVETAAGRFGAAMSPARIQNRNIRRTHEQIGVPAHDRGSGRDTVGHHVQEQAKRACPALLSKPAQTGVGIVLRSEKRMQ